MLGLRLSQITVTVEGLTAPVLAIDDLAVAPGEQLAVTGPSGSGKSTLVNVVTGLAKPASGRVLWGETDIACFGEGSRDRWRSDNVGLVMQDFHLFAGLSALDNVLLPARLRHRAGADEVARARALLGRVGIGRPAQDVATMSRGEQQRVAVARALLASPGVIVADEPTASLDRQSGEAVIGLLLALAAEEGATLIAVSHDDRLISRLQRVVALRDGRIAEDRKGDAA
jgi:putative ABC transport system ATP-binding protein